ncbi:MAG TPA: mercury(II) reductase, partial [Aliiroseovarius sp.]|nr:mercury(II) reductase [Aliiroseovarius sp.]
MKDCCKDEGGDGDGGTYDLAVIGAGSAGFSAAITAAEAGARVALIGHGTIGGTCVNVGCVPSKAMIRAVEVLHQARAASRFDGLAADARVTDWAALVRQKQALVDELRTAKYTDVLPNYERVTYIEGKAGFRADGTLEVDGRCLRADKIVIATGARPHVPDISGLDTVDWLDSTSALALETLPKSLLIMGAGFIAAELGQIFARAGVEVTIVTRRRLLPEAEPEISAALTGYFAAEGIRVEGGLTYVSVSGQGGQVRLEARRDGAPVRFAAERLLLTTGRVPNTAGMGLAAAGITLDRRGGIVVGPDMQTSRKGVYAAGDVTGRDQFVYMAAYGARLAASNAVDDGMLSYDNSTMPAVVFSDPQVASVGMTEAEARKLGLAVVVSVLPLEHVPRALAARDTRGLIKLVAEAGHKRLLGAHILAPEGADTIQTAAVAIRAGMTYE